MSVSEMVLFAAEIIGTVAFAFSGAMVAIDRGLDLFGVMFLGVITALGGGTVRDILIGRLPPAMFYDFHYVVIAIFSAVAVFVAVALFKNAYIEKRARIERILNLFDAVGLGVFAVVGTQAGIAYGHSGNAFFCVFLGMTTGVGGGILRDLLAGQRPYVLVKHIYAVAAIGGAFIYYVLAVWCELNKTASVFIGIALVISVRLLASHYRWNLPRVSVKMDEK